MRRRPDPRDDGGVAKLVVLNMPSEAEWAPKKGLPKALVPVERSTDPCPSCPATCCHAVVHVTIVEAARIATALTLPFSRFVRAVAVDPPRAFEPSAVVVIDGVERRLAFVETNEAHRCVFLHDVGESRRCSIHPLRPGICRQYPFKLKRGRLRVDVGTEAYCPTGWLWNDATVAAQDRHLDAWLADRKRDARLAAAWNEQGGGSLDALCRFAIEAQGGDVDAVFPPPRRRLGG